MEISAFTNPLVNSIKSSYKFKRLSQIKTIPKRYGGITRRTIIYRNKWKIQKINFFTFRKNNREKPECGSTDFVKN